MIQKLRFRLIRLAVLFQLVLLIVIVLFSNYLSYLKLADTADTVIEELWKEPWADYEPSPSPSPAAADSDLEGSFLEDSVPEDSALDSSAEASLSEEPSDSSQESPPSASPTWQPPKTAGPMTWRDWANSAQNWTPEEFAAWQEWWRQMNKKGPHGEPPPPPDPEGSLAEPTASPSPSPEPPEASEPSAEPVLEPTPEQIPEDKRPSEVPFESRYFIVTESTEGELLSLNMEHIISVSPVEALNIVQEIKQSGTSSGFQDYLRYGIRKDGKTVSYLFLDCRRDLETFRSSLIANCLISLLGLLIVFGLMVVFSRKIVQPVAESYEKQKQFISAAGHELRTPLTILSADAELLKMDVGENEWLQDMETQTTRMSELVGSLLTLSRMDEGREPMQMIEFPVSDLVEETVRSFEVLALGKGETLDTDLQPMLSMVGDEKAIRQLVSIFMDNAVKYSTGSISVSLKARDGQVVFYVENTAEQLSQEQLSQFFDRFYRAESSRNSETGGYGLGLAIAKSIVEAHKGQISATSPEPGLVRLTAVLPQEQ